MSFFGAVQSAFRNYANFKGRAVRSEYWWFALFSALAQGAASGFGDSFGNLVSVVLLLPSIAVGVRRIHDTNRRGWWLLFPIVNIVMLAQRGTVGENRFGPPPPPRAN